MELLVIRHALPMRVEGAMADGLAIPANPPLSEIGHEQSRRLAEWLAPEGIDALYVSPLARALETAAPVADRLGLEPTTVDGIAEYDRDSDSYVPIEELKANNDPRWVEMVENGGYLADEGHDAAAFQTTVVAAFEEIIEANKGRKVAVVCHGGVLLTWTSHILGLANPGFLYPIYTSISRFQASSRGHRSVVTLNETPHLRQF